MHFETFGLINEYVFDGRVQEALEEMKPNFNVIMV
jgi:hypothetical protein